MSNRMTNYQRFDSETRVYHGGREDLRERSDRELVLIVSNSETLYEYRKHMVLWDLINNRYVYTAKQLSELEAYLSDEV